MGDRFTIRETDLFDAVISVINTRRPYSSDGPTIDDCENLKKIIACNCSKKTKETVVDFMLKFGKSYKKDFPELIEDLWKSELNHTDRKRRDHVCHSFRVWSLGLWLYQNGLKEYFDKIPHNSDRFYFVWYLTAFYHDVGYVKNNALHGGDSAQLLLKHLNKVFSGKWTPDAIHAIVAICLHDQSGYPIDIQKDPYSALLIISDELQEWGRNIKGRDPKAEIDQLVFCLNFTPTTPTIGIRLCYPRNLNVGIGNLDDEIHQKEGKLNDKFHDRIKNLEIHVECKAY